LPAGNCDEALTSSVSQANAASSLRLQVSRRSIPSQRERDVILSEAKDLNRSMELAYAIWLAD